MRSNITGEALKEIVTARSFRSPIREIYKTMRHAIWRLEDVPQKSLIL